MDVYSYGVALVVGLTVTAVAILPALVVALVVRPKGADQ